jgi:large subunit ribosomal protein L21
MDMKKAVIATGGKQYVVAVGDTINVELIKDAGKSVSFEPLLTIDGDSTEIGTPTVAKTKVTAEVVEADIQADKVTAIRYKAKKRVHKVRGHRQHQTVLKITKIA